MLRLRVAAEVRRIPWPSQARKRWFRRPALPLVLVLAITGCGESEEEPDVQPPVVLVDTSEAGRAMAHPIVLPGRVEAPNQAQLSFQVGGRLMRVFVREGASVKAGEVLAEIDDTDLRVRLRNAQVAERNAEVDLQRRRQLQRERILSASSVEQSESSFANARAERESAERQLGYARLTAPYDGKVGRQLERIGTVVASGAPVFSMIDRAVIHVAVNVPAADVLRLPFDSRLTGTGRVLAVVDAVEMPLTYAEHATVPDEQSRTYRLVMRGQPLKDIELLPGIAMRVQIDDPNPSPLGQNERLVAASALLSEPDGGSVLWVADGEKRARRVGVRIVEMMGDRARIAAELPEKARVIVAGGQKLTEGQAVEPRQRN